MNRFGFFPGLRFVPPLSARRHQLQFIDTTGVASAAHENTAPPSSVT